MGFPKSYATTILSNVFKTGNTIALLNAIDTTNDTYTEITGTGYARYTIKSGDFLISKGVATTNQHILFGLAEANPNTGDVWAPEDAPVVGIAVFNGSSLLYLGELLEPKPILANTVPVFKKYVEATDTAPAEGIKVTLDVESTSSVSTNGVS